ncbi:MULTISPECIES: metallophosphoesterase family protein [unclassified Marinovum]
MKSADLGRIEGPVLLFGGPYSNRHATQALRAEAARREIPPSACILTGDVVAYCGDPAGTVKEVRDWGCAVIAGNVEKQLAEGAGNCGCGFEEGSTCDRLSAGWYGFADAAMTEEMRGWMAELPDIAVFTQGARRYGVIHGGVADISRFLWSTSPESAFAEEVARLQALVGPVDGVVAGHSGLPFVRDVAGVAWINAGVIGMPPHDGGRDVRFVVLGADGPVIETLAYDWQAAQAEMRAAGLTQGYELGLETGVWPSEDVLPEALRRKSRRS